MSVLLGGIAFVALTMALLAVGLFVLASFEPRGGYQPRPGPQVINLEPGENPWNRIPPLTLTRLAGRQGGPEPLRGREPLPRPKFPTPPPSKQWTVTP